MDIKFGLQPSSTEHGTEKGAEKHQNDKEQQRWVDDKTPGSPFPVPVVLWDACCRVTSTHDTKLKCSIGSVVADRMAVCSKITTTKGANEGTQGTINLLTHALFLGLTGGYAHVTDPTQIADVDTVCRLWRSIRGPCGRKEASHSLVHRKWVHWLKTLSGSGSKKGGDGGAGGSNKSHPNHNADVLLYC